MRPVTVAAVLTVLILAAPAAARVRLAGGTGIAHPTLLGSSAMFERTGFTSDGQPAYILDEARSGGAAHQFVVASTLTVRDGTGVHTTSYAYAASASHLALAELDGSQRGASRLGSVTLSFSGLDGKATDTVLACDESSAPHAPPFAVEADQIAFVQGDCAPGPQSVIVHDIGDGDTTVPITDGSNVTSIAMAGDYLAWGLQGAAPRVVVAARATGAQVYEVDGTAGPFALGSDGTVAVVSGGCPGATSLAIASPGSPAPAVVPGAAPCSAPRLSGGQVVYKDARNLLHAVAPGGGDHTLLSAPVGDFDAADGNAAYVFPDCAGSALYRVSLSESPATPSLSGACPVRVRARALRLHGSRMALSLACPDACHGRVTLRRGGKRAASGPFAVDAPGNGTVQLRLTAAVRSRIGRRRSPATLTFSSVGPSGKAATSHAAVTIRR